MIFWHLPGVTQYDGDDYTDTRLALVPPLPGNFSSYIGYISGRAYLLWLYRTLFELSHQNLALVVSGFLVLYVLSSIALYAALRRLFSPAAALLGAALYLAHGAKWHAVLALNAQGYIAVIIAAVAIFAITSSRLTRGWQCLLVTVLFWLSIHFYEILMLTAPLYLLFWLGPSLVRKQMPPPRDWFYGAAPAVVATLHVYLISLSANPVWNRNIGDDPHYFSKIPAHIPGILCDGFSRLLGSFHWQMLAQSLQFFTKFDLKNDHSLLAPLATAGLAALWFALSVSTSRSDRRFRLQQKVTLVSGLYLALLGPLVALPVSLETVPWRLIFLPIFGLSLALAAAFDLFVPRPLFRLAVLAGLLWCLSEAVAFADIVQQIKSASDTDKKISTALAALPPLPIAPGDRVFISLPFEPRKIKYWRAEPSVYYSNPFPTRLWAVYHLPSKSIEYSSVMRYPKMTGAWGLASWVRSPGLGIAGKHLFPFFLDDEGRMLGVTTITLLDNNGAELEKLNTGLFGVLGPNSALQVKVKPDQATDPRCWNFNCPLPDRLRRARARS